MRDVRLRKLSKRSRAELYTFYPVLRARLCTLRSGWNVPFASQGAKSEFGSSRHDQLLSTIWVLHNGECAISIHYIVPFTDFVNFAPVSGTISGCDDEFWHFNALYAGVNAWSFCYEESWNLQINANHVSCENLQVWCLESCLNSIRSLELCRVLLCTSTAAQTKQKRMQGKTQEIYGNVISVISGPILNHFNPAVWPSKAD